MAETWFEHRRTDSKIHTINLYYSAFSNEMRNYFNQKCHIWQTANIYILNHSNKRAIKFSLGTKAEPNNF